ncbi:hypothetical protein [Streptomyces sp. NBC_01352]|uniref:hypothetical protein n=1 Tax=Streptomyces sp. NBC_01352 TaxID=2903834 RepID=UPI003FCD1519
MAWTSWNSFARSIGYDVIKQQTDALVSSRIPAAGHQYVDLDDGWWQGVRNADGWDHARPNIGMPISRTSVRSRISPSATKTATPRRYAVDGCVQHEAVAGRAPYRDGRGVRVHSHGALRSAAS